MFSRYFHTSSAAFDEQKVVGQLTVCLCACLFHGALWAAIRGKQETHHGEGRKTPAVGGLVEGMLERQQWVVDEELEDSWGEGGKV